MISFAAGAAVPDVTMTSTFRRGKLGCDFGELPAIAISPAKLKLPYGAAFDPIEFSTVAVQTQQTMKPKTKQWPNPEIQ